MNSLRPPEVYRIVRHIIGSRYCSFAPWLTLLILIIPTAALYGINHVSIVGWLPDQRVLQNSQTQFADKYFRIIDPDGTTNFTFTVQSTPNSMWYSGQKVHVSACTASDTGCEGRDDGTGFKVTFSDTPQTPWRHCDPAECVLIRF